MKRLFALSFLTLITSATLSPTVFGYSPKTVNAVIEAKHYMALVCPFGFLICSLMIAWKQINEYEKSKTELQRVKADNTDLRNKLKELSQSKESLNS